MSIADTNIFWKDTRFLWKQAQPWSSLYPKTSGLNYPILFDTMPQNPEVGEEYLPTYFYQPNPALNVPDVTPSILYINNIFSNHFHKCMSYSRLCKLWAPGTQSHATQSCCGFTAPIFAILIDEYYHNRSLIEKPNKSQAEEYEVKQFKIRAEQKSVIFYQVIVGYGKTDEEFSWNSRCQGWSSTLQHGVNLLTFYSSPRRKTDGNFECNTHHHFVVFINPIHADLSIIIDAWAGTYGRRGKWIRTMTTEHLNNVLRTINALTDSKTDIEYMNILLNEYFIVPNKYNRANGTYNNPNLSNTTDKLYVGNINLTVEHARIESMFEQKLPSYISASAKGKNKSKRRGKTRDKKRGKKIRVLTRKG
jgi:hypothetical protein